jgi:hypothetical protein
MREFLQMVINTRGGRKVSSHLPWPHPSQAAASGPGIGSQPHTAAQLRALRRCWLQTFAAASPCSRAILPRDGAGRFSFVAFYMPTEQSTHWMTPLQAPSAGKLVLATLLLASGGRRRLSAFTGCAHRQ